MSYVIIGIIIYIVTALIGLKIAMWVVHRRNRVTEWEDYY